MRFFKSIKFLLTVWYLAILAVLLFFFATIANLMLSINLNRELDQSLVLGIPRLEGVVEVVDGQLTLIDADRLDFDARTLDMLLVYDASGDLVHNWGQSLSFPGLDSMVVDALAGQTGFETVTNFNGGSVRLYTVSITENQISTGLAIAGRSTSDVTSLLNQLATIHAIGGLVTVALAGVGGLFLFDRAFKPVEEITLAAREIEENDLSRRIEVHSDDELGLLAMTLNQMIERLEQAFVRQRQFTGDASHELRTPLSIIQAESTLALRKTRKIIEYQKSLELISRESEHMSALIDSLLFLARSDAGQRQPEMKPLNLTGLLGELAAELDLLCREKDLHCQTGRMDDLNVIGDRVDLKRLFFNLFDNAIRYTPRGGTVSISAWSDGGFARIAVADSGIGIAEEHLPHIFERFYRVDRARSRAGGGTGLGLAICKEIAEAHGGRIEVASRPDEGSTFTVYLPGAPGS